MNQLKSITRIFILTALLTVPMAVKAGESSGIARSATTDSIHIALADAFFELSGLEAQIAEIPSLILMQFEEEKEPFGPTAQQQIRVHLIQAFEEALLENDARDFLRANSTPENLKKVMDWLNSDETRRINDLEIEAGNPESEASREAFFSLLERTPPTSERIRLLNDFDEITDATFNTVAVIANMYMAIITAMNPFAPQGEVLGEEQFETVRNSIIMQLLPIYERVNMMMNLYSYRTLSDNELESYIDFYTTDAGQWFVDISYLTIEHVLLRAQERIKILSRVDN